RQPVRGDRRPRLAALPGLLHPHARGEHHRHPLRHPHHRRADGAVRQVPGDRQVADGAVLPAVHHPHRRLRPGPHRPQGGIQARRGGQPPGALMEQLIVSVLLAFLAATAVAVIRLHNLFTVVMLFGVYRLLSASVFLIMDAGDVAFTEAAVGAGITTVLMLSTVALTGARVRRRKGRARTLLPLALVSLTGLALVWGTLDLPSYGDPDAPIHHHVAPRYIEQSPVEIGIPNMVASILASYRGFDTLGEVTVVFTAGLGVLLLLGGRRKRGEDDEG